MLLGILSAWPAVLMFLFFAVFFSSFMVTPGSKESEGTLNSMVAFFTPAIFLTTLLGMALLVFYIVHVFKNPALAGDKRALWAVVLFLGTPIAMPIYWFLYIWRAPVPSGLPPGIPPPPRAF